MGPAPADAKPTSVPWKHVTPLGHGPPRSPVDDRFWRSTEYEAKASLSPLRVVAAFRRSGIKLRRIRTGRIERTWAENEPFVQTLQIAGFMGGATYRDMAAHWPSS